MPVLLILLLLLVTVAPFPCVAATPDKSELQQIEHDLVRKQAEKQEIDRKLEDANETLEKTRQSLVDLAAAIQNNEAVLHKTEQNIDMLTAEENVLQQKLESDRRDIAALILAAQRLARVPTEAVIIRPGAPIETARTALLLKSVLPRLNRRAAEIRVDYARLGEIKKTLLQDRRQAAETGETLKAKQSEIGALIAEREAIYKDLMTDQEKTGKSLVQLSAKAKDIRDLLKKLEERQRKQEKAFALAARPKPVFSPPQVQHAVARPESSARNGFAHLALPVAGNILTGYGEADDLGAKSRGLRIAARDGALVTTPLAGTVRYAGPFKNYGNLVIVEHAGGYHSLIAGLERIDTGVGQDLAPGEPVGILPSGGNGKAASLYYELRKNGEPVNPATKLAGLSQS